MQDLISAISVLLLSVFPALAQDTLSPIEEQGLATPPLSSEEIFMVVQQMPIFYAEGCPESPYTAARSCADQAMQRAIYDNLRYPEAAQSAGVDGALIVSFIINTDGTTSGHRITHDLGSGTGTEALRVVREFLPRWRPGLQHGMPVPVQYRLPIKFRL